MTDGHHRTGRNRDLHARKTRSQSPTTQDHSSDLHLRHAVDHGGDRAAADLLDGDHLAETPTRDLSRAVTLAASDHRSELSRADRGKGIPDQYQEQPDRCRLRDGDLAGDFEPGGLLGRAVQVQVQGSHRADHSLRLPDPDLAPVHSARDHRCAARHRQFALRADHRLPDLLVAVEHLAPAGLFPERAAGTRRAGDGRWQHPARGAFQDPDPAFVAGVGRGFDLHLHRRLERAAPRPDLHHV